MNQAASALWMWRSFIPNSFSLGNLTFGFFSIIFSSHANLEAGNTLPFLVSGLCIMIAALFDGLDGPLARLLKSQSKLGEQLDSLADLTTFGIAPGFLMYKMYFYSLKVSGIPLGLAFDIPAGIIVSAIFPICAAFRLARFNIGHDSSAFAGLPSPVAGLFIAFFPIFNHNSGYISFTTATIIFIIMALLMVSNIRYTKPQSKVRLHFTILRLVLFVVLISTLMYFFGWYIVVFVVVLLYIFSGLVALLIHLLQKIKYHLTG